MGLEPKMISLMVKKLSFEDHTEELSAVVKHLTLMKDRIHKTNNETSIEGKYIYLKFSDAAAINIFI